MMANYKGKLVFSVQIGYKGICWRRRDFHDLVADANCVERREIKHGRGLLLLLWVNVFAADRKFSDRRADPLVLSHNFAHRRI